MDWKRLAQFALLGNGDSEQYAILLVRVSIGLFFAISGARKVFVAGSRQTMYETLARAKVPLPNFMTYFVSSVEFVGGCLVATGLLSSAASLALLVDMAVAILTTKLSAMPKECFASRVGRQSALLPGGPVRAHLFLDDLLRSGKAQCGLLARWPVTEVINRRSARGQFKRERRAARADLQTHLLNRSEEIYVKQQIGKHHRRGERRRIPLTSFQTKSHSMCPYGLSITLERAEAVIHAAVAEARMRNWKMNVAVSDSGGNLVAFERMDGAMLASIQIAQHKARAAATFRRPTKVFEDGIQLMHLNYLLAFDGIIASRGGIPLIDKGVIIGAIGSSGGTDSQDEIVSEAGAAVINQRAAEGN